MSIESRSAKILLLDMAPQEVIDYLDELKIPSPYKEILLVRCVNKLQRFPALDYLEEHYKIHISYWDHVKKLREAFELVYKAHLYRMQK